jgi:outer membrane murein-binding lipoprotein Lpp
MGFGSRKIIIAAVFAGSLMLAACSSQDGSTAKQASDTKAEQPSGSSAQAAKKEKTVEQALPPIKEAKGVPEKEKLAIMAVLNQYIKSFNHEDVNQYIRTLSPHSTSFKIDDEKQFMQKTFKKMNINMTPKQMMIIDYKGNTANVFTDMDTTVVERSSGDRMERSSRQIITLQKESSGWKISRLFAMENQQ